MSDEKRIKYTVYSNGDVENGYSYDESPQPLHLRGERGNNRRGRFLKRLVVFLGAFVAVQLMLHVVLHHRHGHRGLWHKMFGHDGARGYGGDAWWKWYGGGDSGAPEHEHPHPHPHPPHHPPPPPHWHGHGHKRPRPHPTSRTPPAPTASSFLTDFDQFQAAAKQRHSGSGGRTKDHKKPYNKDDSDPIDHFKHGSAKWRSAFNRINPEAVSLLNKGRLAIGSIGALFHASHDDMCIPSIPVPDIGSYTFNVTQLSKISNAVVGVIGADIRVVPTDDLEASYAAHAMASSEKIASEITLVQAIDEENGSVSFKLQGPKWLNKGECAYASVVIRLPKSSVAVDQLSNSYVYGNFKLSRELARQITFGRFEVNAAVSSIATPPLRASDVSINTVSGSIHGHYIVSSGVAIHSVNGRIDAGINVRNAERSSIVTESVSGSVDLRIVGGFDGSFSARTINGNVEVEDMSDGSSRLHFDRNQSRVKTGTFGPADNTRSGESSLKAAVVNGNVSVEFD
ncbi:hypothetical protein H4R99_007049 [Coemansia sp. RSA 1722]|nr:hypothetical protein LPJ57_005887 [Coemansia sp. RSA 486]KAJ2228273.1 hypothetical protein IWW45_006677 [Coemansia sp. RSA 485]KAJ2590590.1 hypothetical protein H4R99_007049 [Coemansia sp. RSA 1722]